MCSPLTIPWVRLGPHPTCHASYPWRSAPVTMCNIKIIYCYLSFLCFSLQVFTFYRTEKSVNGMKKLERWLDFHSTVITEKTLLSLIWTDWHGSHWNQTLLLLNKDGMLTVVEQNMRKTSSLTFVQSGWRSLCPIGKAPCREQVESHNLMWFHGRSSVYFVLHGLPRNTVVWQNILGLILYFIILFTKNNTRTHYTFSKIKKTMCKGSCR